MDRQTVLAAFDEQIRRHPATDAPSESVERDAAAVRFVAGKGGRSAVTWCGLDDERGDRDGRDLQPEACAGVDRLAHGDEAAEPGTPMQSGDV